MTRRLPPFSRVLAAGVLALVAVLALLHAPPSQRFARNRAIAWLASHGIAASIDHLDYVVFGLRARLTGVSLAALHAPDRPFFTAGAIEVDLPWRALRGRLALEALSVRRGVVRIERGRDGRWNLPEASGDGGGLDRLPVGRLAITDLRVEIRNLPAEYAFEIPHVSIDLAPSGWNVSRGLITAPGLSTLDVSGERFLFRDVSARVEFDGADLTLDPLRMDVLVGDPSQPGAPARASTATIVPTQTSPADALATLAVTGRVQSVLHEPKLDLRVEGSARLEPVGRWLAPAMATAGALRVEARLEGPAAGPRIQLDLRGDHLSVGALGDIAVESTGRLAPDRASIESLTVRVAGGRVEATGRTSLGDGGDAGALEVRWRDLGAGPLIGGFSDRLDRVGSAMTGTLDARWTGREWSALSVSAANEARPVSAGGALALGGRASLDVSAGRWRLRHDHALGPAGRLAGDLSGETAASFEEWTLRGRNRFEGDVGGLLRAAGILGMPISGAAVPLRGGDLRATAAASGTLGSPRADLSLDGRDLVSGRAAGGTLSGRARFASERLHVDGLELRFGDNIVTAEGDLDFNRQTLRVDVAADLPDLGVAAAVANAPPGVPVSGGATLKATLTGPLGAPQAAGRLDSTGFSVAGQRVDRATADVGWSGGELVARSIVLALGDGELTASGALHVDRQRFRLAAAGRGLEVRPLPAGLAQDAAVPLHLRIDRFDFQASRSVGDPVGEGSLALASVRYGDYDAGPGELRATLGGGNATVDLTLPDLGGSIAASISLGAPWAFSVQGQLVNEDLARLVPEGLPIRAAIGGAISLDAEATGTLSPFTTERAAVGLTRLDATIGTTPVRLARAGRLAYAADHVQAQDLAVLVGRTVVTLGGELGDPDDRLTLQVRGGLDDARSLLESAGVGPGVAATGSLSSRIEAVGTLARPAISADLAVQHASIGVPDLPPLTVTALGLQYRDGEVTLGETEASWQEARVLASGRLPARLLHRWLPAAWLARQPDAEGPGRLDLRVTGVTPAVLEPFVDDETRASLHGLIEGTAFVEADALDLAHLRGAMTLTTASVTLTQVPLAQVRPTRVELSDGRLHVEDWEWAGAGNRFVVSGGLDLTAEGGPRFDAAVDGDIDLRLPSAFFRQVATGGRAELSLSMGGPIREPRVDGRIEVRNGEIRVREPRLAATGISGVVVLTRDAIRVDRIRGIANGGRVTLEGEARFPGLVLSSADFSMKLAGVALDYQGLRTELRGLVTLKQASAAVRPVIAGDVVAQRGGYRAPLSLVALAQRLGSAQPANVASRAEASAIDEIRLDLGIRTGDDLVFDNNYARFEAGANLRLGGTVGRPALSGRISLREGGEVYLAGGTYRIETGTIDFANPSRIEPDLSIITRTRASGRDVTLAIRGKPDSLDVDLSSDDAALTNADLASLVLTGRTLGRATADQSGVARQQLVGLLSGEILSMAGRVVGLDAVRIDRGGIADDLRYDATLVAGETDPAGRLTISKRLGPDVEVVLSQSLRDSGGLTWIVTYEPRRLFELRFVSRDNVTRFYELRQEVVFGGARAAARRRPRREQPMVATVQVEAPDGVDRAALGRALKLGEGRRFDFFQWQDDRDRLVAYFRGRGYFEARVDTARRRIDRRPDADDDDRQIALTYTVDPGPATVLEVRGATLPVPVLRAIEDDWARAVFDGFLVEDATRRVREHLAREGHLEATVDAAVEVEDGRKRLIVEIVPGPRVARRTTTFDGNTVFGDARLAQLVRDADPGDSRWLDPAAVVVPIRRAYEQAGLLDAKVSAGPVVIEGDAARLPVSIREGPVYRVTRVELNGARVMSEARLREIAGLEPGAPFETTRVDDARRRLDAAYRREGFNDVQIAGAAAVDREAAGVALEWTIDEGPRSVLEGVDVTGAVRTHPGLVSRAIGLEAGTPVSLEDWHRARKRLYDAGVFRQVDVEPEPSGDPVTRADGSVEQPVRAKVTLQEWPPYRFRYGFVVSDERTPTDSRSVSPGLTSDFQVRNVFGRALTAGVTGRYQKSYREGRAVIGAPRFFDLPLATNVFAARSREVFNEAGQLPFTTTRSVIGAEQRYRRGRVLEGSYSYRYERNRTRAATIDPNDPPFDLIVNIGSLVTTALVDRRDDPFDSRRGWFHSSALEYSSEKLGSDLRFIKYLAQQTFQREVPRGIVLASAARIGLARGFGQDLIPSERFFAGGGNSVRGFRQDSLGPTTALGDPTGGEALVVLNQEVRFPIHRWFRGVAFVDAGNVFLRPSAIDVGDLEVGAGVGLRLVTPFGLFRVDLGYPVSRPSGERSGRWFFSIGQAF